MLCMCMLFIYVCVCVCELARGKGYGRKREKGWFCAMNDKESIQNHLFLQKHVNIYFDATEWGGVFWPWRWATLQTLVKHDMTDRQFTNPLKGTVVPSGKNCSRLRVSSSEIRSQIQVGNVIPISNYTNMKKLTAFLSGDNVCPAPSEIRFDFSVTAGCRSETDVRRLLRLDFFITRRYRVIFQWSPPPTPFPYYSKTSAVWNSNVWSSITSQTQSACEIALSNQAFMLSLLCNASNQSSPLSNPCFIGGFKTDFIKCSISKWATHHSRKVMATLVTWAVA